MHTYVKAGHLQLGQLEVAVLCRPSSSSETPSAPQSPRMTLTIGVENLERRFGSFVGRKVSSDVVDNQGMAAFRAVAEEDPASELSGLVSGREGCGALDC